MDDEESILNKDITPNLQRIFYPFFCPFFYYMGYVDLLNNTFTIKGHEWHGIVAYMGAAVQILWSTYMLISVPELYFKSKFLWKTKFTLLLFNTFYTVILLLYLFVLSIIYIIKGY